MFKTLLVAAVALTLTPGVTDACPSCCNLPVSVAAFSASLYTALVVTSDPRSVASLKVSGRVAAVNEYAVVYDILSTAGYSNAAEVAASASKSIARAKTLSVTLYFDKSAREIGFFLEQNGVMDCRNAESRALECFSYIRRSLRGLDMSKFKSYQRGVIQGLLNWLLSLGFSGDDAASQLAEISMADELFP